MSGVCWFEINFCMMWYGIFMNKVLFIGSVGFIGFCMVV